MPYTSNREFVTLCYERYLRREPVQTEVDGWVSNLVTGRQSRMQVEASFLGSDEFFQGQCQSQPATMVGEWYLRVLGSPVDPAGSQHWIDRYTALGGNRINLAQEFLSSVQYASGPTKEPLFAQHPENTDGGRRQS